MTGTDGACVVVGATGAVGGAIVRRLRREGRRVVAVARSADALKAMAAEDEGILPCVGDIGESDVADALARAVDGEVAMVVQAAGLPARRGIDRIDPTDLGMLVSLKVGGMLRLVRALDQSLVTGSRVVAVGGHFGSEPSPNACGAGVVNAALASLVRQLADVMGPRGVTVHMIAPGPLDTDRLHGMASDAAERRGVDVATVLDEYRSKSPLGRLSTVDQVAWATARLLDPEADALHGATLALDGGARRGLF